MEEREIKSWFCADPRFKFSQSVPVDHVGTWDGFVVSVGPEMKRFLKSANFLMGHPTDSHDRAFRKLC